MGKSKKPRIPNYNHADGPARRGNVDRVGSAGGNRKMHTFSKLSSSSGSMARGGGGGGRGKGKDQDSSKTLKHQKGKQDVKITVPFGRKDRILLVGEGELLFFFFFFNLFDNDANPFEETEENITNNLRRRLLIRAFPSSTLSMQGRPGNML